MPYKHNGVYLNKAGYDPFIIVRDYHAGFEALRMQLQKHAGDCPIDHGERTNKKLKDQPYHMRGSNGKMRKW